MDVASIDFYEAASTFTVTYNANGATSGTVPTDATAYSSGATVTVAGNTGSLAKAGYIFGGWNTAADGSGTDRAVGSNFSISSNTTLYAKWNAKTITSLTYTGTPTKTTYVGGQSFDPTGLTVTATFDDSSEEDVTALVTWTPDPLTAGTTSVTGTYMGETINVTGLTVTAAPGSAGNPYNIVQAKAAIDAGTGVTGVYVHGIISQVDSYNSTYKSITYWISDDGTTTNQFEVYGGLKSANNEDGSFSAKSDLEVGDIVTVYGNITLYGTTYEFSKDNYLTSFKRKADSDLTITSSTPVALERTSAAPSPASTITWTTSSTGAMSLESSNTGVATVSAAGVITAVGEGTATITITQAADDDYKASSEKTVTVNVTDNRSACATGIDLTSAKSILKDAEGSLSATSTAADGFTGSITYTYESADGDIFFILDGDYLGAGVGATTVTVTATPTGGNAANYKPASQEVAVTVNGTNSISLDVTSKSIAFSANTFDIEATVPTDNYNGAVSAESSNEAVATVSVDGTTVTVTPVAVGTATITVTAGTGTYYLATAQEECAVEFTKPAGSTEAPSSEQTVFEETFAKSTGGPLSTWGGSEANGTLSTDVDGWTVTSGSGAGGCAKFGTSSVSGSATTPGITVENGETYTLSFKAAPWSTSDSKTITVTVTGGTISSKNEATTSGMTKQQWNEYEFDIVASSTSLTLAFSCSDRRFFLDDVKVTKTVDPTATVTLNKYGYATYCSVNPIDFSSTTGYTAWRVSDIAADGTITFTKITEAIKGGQGVLLYNKDADGENTSNVTIHFADGTKEFTASENKLVGTTAATNVAGGTVYGLSGNKFVINNGAGNIPAGKAYIEAGSIPASVKSFTFVFEDNATGIIETRQATREEVEAIFNLAGQRLQKMQKGVNIVNGKKVLVK
ncbi:MAG: InlB B-repeat-containing protein [Bacteroidaceae bacterium]|nr:InlB B-repeat-containing protein [Bacteroidaceae bacterium]